MSFFKGSLQPTISDSRLTIARAYNEFNIAVNLSPTQEEGILSTLGRHACFDILHDSSKRLVVPRCDPGTREIILRDIWSRTTESPRFHGPRCLWILGPVGSGKTAIAQTMAEEWQARGRLAASCFLSWPSLGRGELTAIVAAIAYQIALQFPEVQSHIAQALWEDPLLFKKSLATQIERLIYSPLNECNFAETAKPKILVLDGLDQCFDVQSQREMLSLLMKGLCAKDLPLIMLFTSRTEKHIMEFMGDSHRHVYVIQLDDPTGSSADVEAYICHRLGGGQVPPSRPDAIKRLVSRSSGQFLYASRAIDYVQYPGGHLEHRWRIVLGEDIHPLGGVDFPFRELDQLYLQIMRSVDNQQLSTVLDVLAWLVIYGDSSNAKHQIMEKGSLPPMVSPAGLEAIFLLGPGTILECLVNLHPVLEIPPPQFNDSPIQIRHPSFLDFLSRESRSGKFYMDHGRANGRITKRLLRHFVMAKTPKVWRSPPSHAVDIEEKLCHHLQWHTCPSIELKRVLEDILGFNGYRFKELYTFFAESSFAFHMLEFAHLYWSKAYEAIINFLKRCMNELDLGFFGRITLRNRLHLHRARRVHRHWSLELKHSYHLGQKLPAELLPVCSKKV